MIWREPLESRSVHVPDHSPPRIVSIGRAREKIPNSKVSWSVRVASCAASDLAPAFPRWFFHPMELIDFQQDYELSLNDESQAYFPYDLIFSCCQDDLVIFSNFSKLVAGTRGDLFAGFDVGRTRNISELIVLERKPKRLVHAMGKSFDRSSFPAQEAFLRSLLKGSTRVRRLCIDRHGIGMNHPGSDHDNYGNAKRLS